MSIKVLENIQSLMKENQIKNLFQLSKDTGIGYTTIRNWYDREKPPTIEFLTILANFFECSVDYLIGRSDDFGNIQRPEQKEELTPGERELLKEYRRLSPQRKEDLIYQVQAIADREEKETEYYKKGIR